MRCGLAIAACLGLIAAPAIAALDDAPEDAPYRGICQLVQACNIGGGCGTIPALGELLLDIDGDGAQIGQSEETLNPIDLFLDLNAAEPLPDVDGRRREFLVSLPPGPNTRRFALYRQIRDADTGEPALRPRYFILDCTQAPV